MVRHENADGDADLEYIRQLRPDYDVVSELGPDPAAVAVAAPVAPVAPAAPAAPAVSALVAPAAQEWITCPECGEGSMIDPTQRRAEDFCPHCDFPLFWAKSAVVAMAGPALLGQVA